MWGLESIGEALRSAREVQGHSIQDASVATRIRTTYLEALEREEFQTLGSPVYAKGFLRNYATFLGLDAGPLVEAYQSKVGTTPQPLLVEGGLRPIEAGFGGFGGRRRSNWLLLGSVAAAIVLVAGLISLFSPDGGGSRQPTVAAPVTTTPSTPAPPPATTTNRQPVSGVRLVVRYEAPSWSRVQVDGERAFEGTPTAGERRTFKAAKRIVLMLGNAGAVVLTVNGRELGPAGKPGQVWEGEFTPGGPARQS